MSSTVTRERMLQILGIPSDARVKLLLDWSRKLGQIRSLTQSIYLLRKERQKEFRELDQIQADIESLGNAERK